jgi:glycine cleavage system aminomethyltransferase T
MRCSRRRLVPILLADPEPMLFHGESVLKGGHVVGRVTSGAYGHTLGAAVGLAAITGEPDEVDRVVGEGGVEVEIAGERVPARLSARPFYDPDGHRLRHA